MDRRVFLRLGGAAALTPTMAALLAACGGGDDGDVAAAVEEGAAETQGAGPGRPVRLGFIALTDCASLVMAEELGYFAERDLDVTLEKQASWPATRDNLINGQIDGAHCLFGMPFSVATGIGGSGGTPLKIAMMLSNNGQAITLKKEFASVGYADLAAAKAALESKEPTLAMTFPGGTHDTWLRYWLHATKVDRSKVKIIPVPPPNMVENHEGREHGGLLRRGALGRSGRPSWDRLHPPDDPGPVAEPPGEGAGRNEGIAAQKRDVLADVMAAVLKASQWLDDLANRVKASTTIGDPAYVNAPAADSEGRLLGRYDLGAGLPAKTYEGDQMVFFRDGAVNRPRRGHGIWFLAQYQRFGLLKEPPPYMRLVDDIILSDLYTKVAADEGIAVPDDDMAPFDIQLDGVTFDPTKPEQEVARP